MDDILAKKNRHLFLEEKDNVGNSFIANVNKVAESTDVWYALKDHTDEIETIADNIDDVHTVAENIDGVNTVADNINDIEFVHSNIENGTLEALLDRISNEGNDWLLRIAGLGNRLLNSKNAFNYAAVATIPSDIVANATITLPESMSYLVGTHMLLLSWNGTVCYKNEQYKEIGTADTWSTTIKTLVPLKAGDKLEFRTVAVIPADTQVIATGSLENRTLADRFGDVYNVKDFGAVGDGVTDDTSAISTAISTALEANAKVFFPAGRYLITSGINLTADFFGDGYLYDGTNAQCVEKAMDLYVSTAGGGTGLSAVSPTTLTIAQAAVQAHPKHGYKIHFASGTYTLSATCTFDGCEMSLVGQSDASTVIIDGSNLSGTNYQCFLLTHCKADISGISFKNAPNNGLRIQDKSDANIVNCIFSENTQNGLSIQTVCNFNIENCTASSNGWSGFAVGVASSGVFNDCTSSDNKDGFQCNYTGNVFFENCEASDNTRAGYFISGCEATYINNSESSGNATDGILASGLARVSVQYTTLSGNKRGVFAEYGADITICQCNINGLLADNSRGIVGIGAEYGSRATIAGSTEPTQISGCQRGLWAYYGGTIYLARPVDTLLTISNCNSDYVPGLDQFGANGGCIYGGSETTTSDSMPSFMGQIGDAVAKGPVDFDTLITSGIYTTDGSSENRPADYGQTIVVVYKRPTNNATRKIVQLCFNLSVVGEHSIRIGSCANGDDSSITWSAWASV